MGHGAGLRGHGQEAACGGLVEAEGACCQCYDQAVQNDFGIIMLRLDVAQGIDGGCHAERSQRQFETVIVCWNMFHGLGRRSLI
jgi:hypothetical protein